MVSVACIAGCGRIAFDPLGETPPIIDDANGDTIGGEGGPAACLTSAEYATKAGFNNRYREGTMLVSWAEARTRCMADGADLWIPSTTNEATAWSGDWVGITDAATEGTWITVEGTPATFLPWETGQPDGGGAEDCARNTGNMFEDRECTDTRDYVCECGGGG